jgi:hypothetical protein
MKGFDTEEWYEQYQAKRRASKRAPKVETVREPAVTKQIIRQSSKGMNKTETRFYNEILKPMLHAGEIDKVGEHESITILLANGLRFRPDFPTWKDGRLTFFEVKCAFIREDAKIKLKVAPSEYEHCRFILYQYIKGEWFKQEVLP